MENPRLEKQWTVSRILNCSPFASEVLDLNDIQLDYIIRRYAKEHPEEVKLREPPPQPLLNSRKWMSVLTGKDLREYTSLFIPKFLRDKADGGSS